MKIMHIIISLESGGAERMLSNLVSNDKENEHIILTVLKRNHHYNIDETVNVIDLQLENTVLDKIKSLILILISIKKIKPDIVQSWLKLNYFAPILKILNKKPKYIINIRHGVNKKYDFVKSYIENKYLNIVDGCIFVSKSSLNEFKECGIKINNSVVINNGFKIKEKINKDYFEKPLILGYVGRKDQTKNQRMLFNAFNNFAKDKNVELHIAGKDMSYKNFKVFIDKEVKEKIIWYGELKNTDILYENIDLLILTSKTEGFPNVIGEAMSFGIPVISTNAGESWDIIKNSGYKIGFDSFDLVNVLERIYSNPLQLRKKSENAYKIIKENFTINKIVKEYKKYYKKVLK